MSKVKPKEPELVVLNRKCEAARLTAKNAYEATLMFPNDPSVLHYYVICAEAADQAAIEVEKLKFKPRGVAA